MWHSGILRRQTQLISFVKSFSTRSSSSSFSFPPHNSEILTPAAKVDPHFLGDALSLACFYLFEYQKKSAVGLTHGAQAAQPIPTGTQSITHMVTSSFIIFLFVMCLTMRRKIAMFSFFSYLSKGFFFLVDAARRAVSLSYPPFVIFQMSFLALSLR